MGILNEIITTYGMQIIGAILTAIATFIGTKIKALYEEYVNNDTKKKVVEDTVRYVEQIYKDLKGEQKLKKAKENILALLNEKGISITELELDVLIESTCNGFKKVGKE